MKLPLRLVFVAAVAVGLDSVCLGADTKSGLAADNRILAQPLVNRLVAQDPSLLTAGMPCVAPGGAVPTIVASTRSVSGKPSDPNDVDLGEHGFTLISPNPPKAKIGVMRPLPDRAGKLIGALALAFKFRDGDDPVKCLAAAGAIRDRVARDIPGRAGHFATSA